MKTTTVFTYNPQPRETQVVALVKLNTLKLPEVVPDALLAIIDKDPLMVIDRGMGWNMVVDYALPEEECPNFLRWGDDKGWSYIINGEPDGSMSHYYLEVLD